MKKNVGNLDRWLRIILGVAILGAGLAFKSWWGLIGILPVLTGITRRCGLYKLMGINTCQDERKD
jgi:hypothetical protein